MTLRVILQIVPQGDEDNVREIGRLDIFNKGPVGLAHEYGVINLSPNQAGLYNYTIAHIREDGAWKLVRLAIAGLNIT
jgi:hypothetical protein